MVFLSVDDVGNLFIISQYFMVNFRPLMLHTTIPLIKCPSFIHALGSQGPIQYFAVPDRPGSHR